MRFRRSHFGQYDDDGGLRGAGHRTGAGGTPFGPDLWLPDVQ